jgi:hypothetical protein
MSMYTTKIQSINYSTERIFYIFYKRQISIKLFYLYQRLQCTDHYLFKIKFVFFVYLLLSASLKENDLSWNISVIRQTVKYRTPVFNQSFSWRVHITITYNLPHLRLCRISQPHLVYSEYGCFESCQFRSRSVFFVSWRLKC